MRIDGTESKDPELREGESGRRSEKRRGGKRQNSHGGGENVNLTIEKIQLGVTDVCKTEDEHEWHEKL